MWTSLVASLCGSLIPSALMFLKARLGILPAFQPYDSVQTTLVAAFGTGLPPSVLWILSFLNGAVVLGFLFGQAYRWLPGTCGATKGLVFGLTGWIAMGLLFFPMIGMGFFAAQSPAGAAASLLSLAMIVTYSVTMGMVYAALERAGKP
ncbi:DUF6789 family protein [Phreatobacter aquaticus]|nr:DUF6789 family protein [Phreatobacter aquaticus]